PNDTQTDRQWEQEDDRQEEHVQIQARDFLGSPSGREKRAAEVQQAPAGTVRAQHDERKNRGLPLRSEKHDDQLRGDDRESDSRRENRGGGIRQALAGGAAKARAVGFDFGQGREQSGAGGRRK